MSLPAGEWVITPDERAKHDAQFSLLNPAGGFLTGDAARGFFLKSGLPPMVLGQIWELSDINKDGKLDAREFSIAMYFIKLKLSGRELPTILPDSLKRDPGASNGNSNQTLPITLASAPSSYGTLPFRPAGIVPMQGNSTLAFDGLNVVSGSTFPRAQAPLYAPVATQPITSSYAAVPLRPAIPTPTYGTVQTSSVASPVVTSAVYGPAGGALAGGIPPNQWQKYAQLMLQYDVAKKGYLNGNEARNVLMQSGLATNLLAQIWNLSDADCDGNLNQNEFCVAMHLTEIARTGQPLPAQLPPAMLVAPVIQQASTMPASGSLQQLNEASQPRSVAEEEAKSFEDKRQENFKKGEAELERRRLMLQEQLKAEEEARMAAQRAEEEKREQQRQETERKRQEELRKQMEKQAALEREREEQRQKAIEQREQARLQLERQRQAEWERQRREQLSLEKQREKNQLELRRSRITDLKFESNSIESKQSELNEKVARLKENIAMVTAAIDAMKQTRDLKVQGIDGMKGQYMEANSEYAKVHAEREQLKARHQQLTLSDPIADEMNQLRQQLSQRQSALDRLRGEMDQLTESSVSRQSALNAVSSRLAEIQGKTFLAEESCEKARQVVCDRRARFRSKKSTSLPKQQSLNNGWDNSGSNLSAAFGSISVSKPNSVPDPFAAFPNGSNTPLNGSAVDKWDAFGAAFSSAVPAAASANAFESAFGATSKPLLNGSQAWPPSSSVVMGNGTYSNGQHDSQNNFNAFSTPFSNSNMSRQPDFNPSSAAHHSKSYTRYRVIYTFNARNEDELDLQEGDVINVPPDQSSAEPGWVYGEINGRYGMVPENYIQRLETSSIEHDAFSPSVLPPSSATASVPSDFGTFPNSTPLQQLQPSKQQNSIAQTDLCVALYNYESPESGDLNFNQGDIIQVVSRDGEWWTGSLNGRQGMFPATFVKPLDADVANTLKRVYRPAPSAPSSASDAAPPSFSPPALDTNTVAASYGEDAEVNAVMSPASSSQPQKPSSLLPSSQGTATERLRQELENKLASQNQAPPKSGKQSTKKPEIVTVIAEYRATGTEQLTLEPGNLIYIKKKSDSGWWQGELHARGKPRQVGWFPANYVRPWTGGPGGSRQSSRTTPVLDIEADREKVITMYPYSANHDDELTFKKDEVINVINKDDPDWWRGELNGIIGVFPSNYVKPIIQSSLQPKPFEGNEQFYQETDVLPRNLHYDNVVSDLDVQSQQNDNYSDWIDSNNVCRPPEPAVNQLNSSASATHSSQYFASSMGSHSPGEWSVEGGDERRERKRAAAVEEFIKSEEDYVQDLHTAVEVFLKPLTAGGALSDDMANKIFINWEELISCNMSLLKPLRVRKQMIGTEPLESIADIVSAALPHFSPYIRYCAAHQNALALLKRVSESEKKFNPVHQACMRDSRSGGLPLSSFLLKPVQRVTKYHLLIKKILDYTQPEYFDFEDLQEAHAKAVQLCEQVNHGVEQRENSQRLEWLQNRVDFSGAVLQEKVSFNSNTNCVGPRRLLFHGSLAKVSKGSLTDSLLFTDDPRVSDVRLKVDKQPFLLDSISAKSVERNSSNNSSESLTDFTISLKDANGVIRTVYELRGRTSVDRNNWVKNINDAVGQYLPKQAQSRVKRSMSIYKTNAVGRLSLIVVSAKDLPFARPPKGKPDAFCLLTLGEQEFRTRVISGNCNPEWNEPAQFILKNTDADVLCLTVYDREIFSPNSFLGGSEIRIKDLLSEHESLARSLAAKKSFIFKSRPSQQPLVKRLQLFQAPGQKGAVVLKLDIQLFSQQIPASPGAKNRESNSTADDSVIPWSASQQDLSSINRRVQSGYQRRLSQNRQVDEALKRRALSTVALDDWGD